MNKPTIQQCEQEIVAVWKLNSELKTYNKKLEERIAELERSRKDLIEEFAEAECMGDLGKIARNYGYIEQE
jgi:cell division protein FtsB